MKGDDFQSVRDTAAESVLGRFAQRIALTSTAAWIDSNARRSAINARAAWSDANAATRVRHGAIAVTVAAAINVAILAVSPVYAAPGIPRAVIAMAGIIAFVVSLAPASFATAWTESRAGRLWRRLLAPLHTSAE